MTGSRPTDTITPATSQRRRWARRGKRAAVLLLLAALTAGLVQSLLPDPVVVDVAPARTTPLRVTIDEDGVTRIRSRYVVSAPLSGSVDRITLRPGDPVHAGHELVHLLPGAAPLLDARSRSETEARLRAARARHEQALAQAASARLALALAQRQAERQRALARGRAIPPSELEQVEFAERVRSQELAAAEFAVRVAAQEVALVRAALTAGAPARREGGLAITAPVDGVVLRVERESAGVVLAGAPLLEIGDPSALEVVVDVLTTDAVQLTPGARAELVHWGGDRVLTGRVRRIEPAAFTRVSVLGIEEQRVNVLVDLDGEPARWARLGDGFRVEVRLVVWESPATLTIPAGALFRHADRWAVYRVADGRAARTTIDVGRTTPELAQVHRGLRPGDPVIVYPSDAITDGSRITAGEAR